jgi:putative membrane protein
VSPVHWLSLATGLVAAHLVANVVWIGALLSVATLVARAPWMAEPAEVGALARRLHVRLASPAFLASLATGLARIALNPQSYAHQRWFHAKLAVALMLIVFHHTIGARAGRVAEGNARAAQGASLLGVLAFLCAAAAVVLGVAKSLP